MYACIYICLCVDSLPELLSHRQMCFHSILCDLATWRMRCHHVFTAAVSTAFEKKLDDKLEEKLRKMLEDKLEDKLEEKLRAKLEHSTGAELLPQACHCCCCCWRHTQHMHCTLSCSCPHSNVRQISIHFLCVRISFFRKARRSANWFAKAE